MCGLEAAPFTLAYADIATSRQNSCKHGSALDDSPNLIGASMMCSDNNRPRLTALLTIGSYFH